MSLPWFAFHADAYTGDTSHLTCEEHGAYLLLMLAYYRSEKPLPATDRALSSITKLPMDRWLEAKPTLAAFFIEDKTTTQSGEYVVTKWRHTRIEAEIAEGHQKRQASVDRATSAAEARWNRPRSKPKASPSNAQAILADAPLPLPLPITLSLPAATEMEPDDEEVPDTPLGTPVDPKWQPSDEMLIECAADTGSSEQIVTDQIRMFIAHHLERGTFSHDWNSTWVKFWQRWRVHRDQMAAKAAPKPRAPPRVEVNAARFEPNTEQWEKAASMFSRGMHWPKAGYGPDPDSLACRCPGEILVKHGLRKERVP